MGKPLPHQETAWVELPLSNGGATLVDAADLEWLPALTWRRNPGGYVFATVQCKTGRKVVQLHRLIAGARVGQVVDHANGDTLDNRRSNLRACAQRRNCQNRKRHSNNTSGFKGVLERDGYFRAFIMLNGYQLALGQYNDAIAAALAYDRAALEHFGEFARPNFDSKRDWLFPQDMTPRPRSGQGQRAGRRP